MTSSIPTGPFEFFSTNSGQKVPLYLIPFDKKGRCEGPLTQDELLHAVASGEFTDIHIFSHGWNNIFKEALERYRSFFTGYLSIRDQFGLNNPEVYRPLFVGILWPSTALVLPWEEGPDIAGAGGQDQPILDEQFALRELASDLPDDRVSRFYELAQRGRTLTRVEGIEFAEILSIVYRKYGDTELGTDANISADDLLKVWHPSMDDSGEGGFAPDETEPKSDQPATAGVLDFLDPRNAIRMATVWQMKDRAGTVGAHGVGPMLHDILKTLEEEEKARNTRVHLMGHSYGAKVVLSALCYPSNLPRKITSTLLLQPAISYLCFGENIDENGRHGGFRKALQSVDRPIFTTFSKNDAALTKFFHLAVRRDSDLGEQKIAGIPPSKFAALGGFGPGGMQNGESKTIPMPEVGTRYPLEGFKILGIDGSDDKIKGHGDVSNRFTEWALVNLVSGEKRP
ncbi:hypothetical protein IVG45_10710 [Methylomonas sp. LL1]|uniref:hypothetical protein n=1 Tax=Methylomonas sp. LL1 TaxID=2785785 RepID=UPI0018C38FBE|nr:hypothetical protein [Methylomonas sp. LL1]QPK65361.1 hypothetical protein IVG45_10710 [Methylomonas sp. LL1]